MKKEIFIPFNIETNICGSILQRPNRKIIVSWKCNLSDPYHFIRYIIKFFILSLFQEILSWTDRQCGRRLNHCSERSLPARLCVGQLVLPNGHKVYCDCWCNQTLIRLQILGPLHHLKSLFVVEIVVVIILSEPNFIHHPTNSWWKIQV